MEGIVNCFKCLFLSRAMIMMAVKDLNVEEGDAYECSARRTGK